MKNLLKILVIVVLLFCFLFLVPSGAHIGYAEIIEIPVDAESQLKKNPEAIPLPLESGYISEKEYVDPSISVRISTIVCPAPIRNVFIRQKRDSNLFKE